MATDDIIEQDGSLADAGESMFGATSEDSTVLDLDDSQRDAIDALQRDQYNQTRDFGKSWEFDFDARRFVKRGGQVATTDGLDTLRQWCMNVLNTERFTTVVCSDDIGIESEDVIRGEAPPAVLAQRIEEALTVHDRISGVTDFKMLGMVGHSLVVSFVAQTTAGSVQLQGRIG